MQALFILGLPWGHVLLDPGARAPQGPNHVKFGFANLLWQRRE